MLQLLRDPAWNGIAGIAAIIALIIAVQKEKRVVKALPRIFTVTGRVFIGINNLSRTFSPVDYGRFIRRWYSVGCRELAIID